MRDHINGKTDGSVGKKNSGKIKVYLQPKPVLITSILDCKHPLPNVPHQLANPGECTPRVARAGGKICMTNMMLLPHSLRRSQTSSLDLLKILMARSRVIVVGFGVLTISRLWLGSPQGNTLKPSTPLT